MMHKRCLFCKSLLTVDASRDGKFCDNLCAEMSLDGVGSYDMVGAVLQFQERFGIPMSTEPVVLPPDIAAFRIRFIQEELDEYREACEAGDIVKQFDALLDIMYVVIGTALRQGLYRIDEGFARVHRTNMLKRLEEGPANGPSKGLVKPAGWKPPYLADLTGGQLELDLVDGAQ